MQKMRKLFSLYFLRNSLILGLGIGVFLHFIYGSPWRLPSERIQSRPSVKRPRLLSWDPALSGASVKRLVPSFYLGTRAGHPGTHFSWELDGGFHSVHKCFRPCRIVQAYEAADLVLIYFYPQDVRNWKDLLAIEKELMKKNAFLKKSMPLWGFIAVEAPFLSYVKKGLSLDVVRRINWTITFRHDSSIHWRYSEFKWRKRVTEIPEDLFQKEMKLALQAKRGTVAAVISHCVPYRLRFIRELRKHIDVDVYGRCERRPCPGEEDNPYVRYVAVSQEGKANLIKCKQELAKKYFFYLAIENQICTDYVTEKLFFSLHFNVVPVSVAGPWNTSMVPPNSFIDYGRQFRSPKDLALRMRWLIQNPSEYLKFLEWKRFYELRPHTAACDICDALYNFPSKVRPVSFKKPEEFKDWWFRGANCYAKYV